MKSSYNTNAFETKSLVRLIIITLAILSLTFMAMLFEWHIVDPGSTSSDRVNWDVFDFLVMASLIFGMGLSYEILKTRFKQGTQRVIFAMILLGLFVLTWAELAVGIFGTPFAGS